MVKGMEEYQIWDVEPDALLGVQCFNIAFSKRLLRESNTDCPFDNPLF